MRDFCVCVPARNEATTIGVLLEGLARQDVQAPVPIALCVNNTTDNTVKVAQRIATQSNGRLRLVVEEHGFPPELAHAGSARRAAMDLSASMLGNPGALLISTDADCRPPENWVSANLAAAVDDDLIIGGLIQTDAIEGLPPGFIAMCERFDAYWQAVRDIEDEIDPIPWDPAPRHGNHTGASIALTVGLYRAAGGVPVIPSGEDCALVEAAIAAAGRLVHPMSVWIRASARAEGRAEGGMSVEMQRPMDNMAAGVIPMVPDFAHWRERAEWRRATRSKPGNFPVSEAEKAFPPMPHDMILPEFG